jgi:hypothetical protein
MAVNLLACSAIGAVHPGSSPAQLKGTSLVVGRLVEVMPDNSGNDSLEIGTSPHGRLPLNIPRIRAPNHTNVAVTPRLSADPFDRIVAVVELVDPRVENAIGVVTASHILGHINVAVLGVEDPFIYQVLSGVVIRCTEKNHRSRNIFFLRMVYISREMDAIPHRDFEIISDLYRSGQKGAVNHYTISCHQRYSRQDT